MVYFSDLYGVLFLGAMVGISTLPFPFRRHVSNNLAKIKVCAVFHSRVIWRSVPPKFIKPREVTLCWCPRCWRDTNVVVVKKPEHLSFNFAIQAKVITLELRKIEIKTSSRARTTDQEKNLLDD